MSSRYTIAVLSADLLFRNSKRSYVANGGHDERTALSHGHLLMLTGLDKGSVLNHGRLILLTVHDTSTALGIATTCCILKIMTPVVY